LNSVKILVEVPAVVCGFCSCFTQSSVIHILTLKKSKASCVLFQVYLT